MNKHLVRLCGTVLAFEALFMAYFYFPLIGNSITRSSEVGVAALMLCLFVIAVALLFISGTALLSLKKWGVVTFWFALLVSFAYSVLIGNSSPAFVLGGFQVWIIDLILAIYLTLDLRSEGSKK